MTPLVPIEDLLRWRSSPASMGRLQAIIACTLSGLTCWRRRGIRRGALAEFQAAAKGTTNQREREYLTTQGARLRSAPP